MGEDAVFARREGEAGDLFPLSKTAAGDLFPLETDRRKLPAVGDTTLFSRSDVKKTGLGVRDWVLGEWGGLVFKAHRLLYHSTLGLRVIKKKKKGSGVQGIFFPGVPEDGVASRLYIACAPKQDHSENF